MKKLFLAFILLALVLVACVPANTHLALVTPSSQVIKETVIVPATVMVTVQVPVTAAPANTATFAPTVPRSPAPTSTNTLVPQPTATLSFPTPTPTRIVKSVNGVVGLAFSVEKTTVRVNEDIWFNFTVKNTNAFDVAYAGIGAVINDKKSQPSWGDATLGAGATLEWRDHINYGIPGKYKIYLGYCWLRWRYECERTIDANGWAWLSEPVELTITE